jgi:sarcosine oxidase
VTHYDTIVAGLGGMGSAALAQLALRGARVLGLEQYQPAHALGSSHGGSRIIRKAYYEDPSYVPLLLRAYELWRQLEVQTNSRLFLRTGGLMAGFEGCEIVEGSLASARRWGLEHELLRASDIKRRFPMLSPRTDELALFEPDAGVLFPEGCVLAHLQQAVSAGAEARFGVSVRGWERHFASIAVRVEDETLYAESLIICAGPWLGRVLENMHLPLQVERNVMHWFDPVGDSERFGPDSLPIYVLERRAAPVFYGIPYLPGQGLKAAFHYSGHFTSPESIDREVSDTEVATMREALAGWLPGGAGAWRESRVCMYTNSPDQHFVIDRHPECERVIFAGGFSGHGFKFCPVIGEILAELAIDGETRHDIALFASGRFASKTPGAQ